MQGPESVMGRFTVHGRWHTHVAFNGIEIAALSCDEVNLMQTTSNRKQSLFPFTFTCRSGLNRSICWYFNGRSYFLHRRCSDGCRNWCLDGRLDRRLAYHMHRKMEWPHVTRGDKRGKMTKRDPVPPSLISRINCVAANESTGFVHHQMCSTRC